MRFLVLLVLALTISFITPLQGQYRKLPVSEYVDKMKAGWIGQMAGVGQGAPTEFRYCGTMIPPEAMPAWKPEMVNQFHQDDIYVEMTFLRSLELYGFDVSIRQAGIDFANSGYPLWHANLAGRENLRKGIAPPDSSHPAFNSHADDIDYQIEADFSGLIAPGMPNLVIELGEKFGRLMNYGDGLYGGQFVGAMYAEAFFTRDIPQIIQTALAAIPAESQYAECIRDVIQWHQQNPHDWPKTWELINQKYQLNPDYRQFSCSDRSGRFNIDAKINGAYIVMGLLYGRGDLDQTIIIATRCGQDSDCNPSNAAGILATTIGFDHLPRKYVEALNPEGKFSHTPYSYPRLIEVCTRLAHQAVFRQGGHVESDPTGEQDCFLIPVKKAIPGQLQISSQPGPIANSRYSIGESALITAQRGLDLSDQLAQFAPGWKIAQCGFDMNPGLRENYLGKSKVLLTHPLDKDTPCILSRKLKVPKTGNPKLHLTVSHHTDPAGDWELKVLIDKQTILTQTIGNTSADNRWLDIDIDLTPYAGKTINLELLNQPTGWSYEAAYWASIQIK